MVLCQDTLSVLNNIFKGFTTHIILPRWDGVAAEGSITFKSQEEHSLIDDVTFCGLLQQFYCLYVGCQFFICATVQLIISHSYNISLKSTA